MVECGFAAYLDTAKAGKRIVIHKTDCIDHKSHEGHEEEWFYKDTYQDMKEFAEQKARENGVNVHNCKHCIPNQ